MARVRMCDWCGKIVPDPGANELPKGWNAIEVFAPFGFHKTELCKTELCESCAKLCFSYIEDARKTANRKANKRKETKNE